MKNQAVVKDIETTLHQEFCCYGYRNMTGELKDLGWIINHKKVYSLMKQHKLLFGGWIRLETTKRDFIRFEIASCSKATAIPKHDIKYVHIHGWRGTFFF